jgi:hypothetical protein
MKENTISRVCLKTGNMVGLLFYILAALALMILLYGTTKKYINGPLLN